MDHADSEYVSSIGVDCKGAEFIYNKQIHSHTDTHYRQMNILSNFPII